MEFLQLDDKDEQDIMFEVFDLNDLQQEIFHKLEQRQLTVKEISDKVDRNRSTVQRALQEMLDKDLLMREGKTDKTVYYVYTTLPIDQLKQITLETLDDWYNQVEEKLD
ncbi:MAG: putative transcriptional regulator [Colwellia polaris]|jgi:predicted transcriptional regulator